LNSVSVVPINPGGSASASLITSVPTVAPLLTNVLNELSFREGGVTMAVPSKGTSNFLFSMVTTGL
jgi:hypothetical protein